MPGASTALPFDVRKARACYQRREAERRAGREILRLECLDKARLAIRRLAPEHLGVQAVYLFGSILKPGRFTTRSDVDVAVACDNVEAESRFWGALDGALDGRVDLRPLEGAVASAVELYGERVYERKAPGPQG